MSAQVLKSKAKHRSGPAVGELCFSGVDFVVVMVPGDFGDVVVMDNEDMAFVVVIAVEGFKEELMVVAVVVGDAVVGDVVVTTTVVTVVGDGASVDVVVISNGVVVVTIVVVNILDVVESEIMT